MDPEKFLQYDAENPEIWSEFEAIALDLIKRGRTHYSAYAILEVIRHHTIIKGSDEFKVNNNYRSGYARKFAVKYPQYRRFFELREKRIAVRGWPK
jgi:hypothetical protein